MDDGVQEGGDEWVRSGFGGRCGLGWLGKRVGEDTGGCRGEGGEVRAGVANGGGGLEDGQDELLVILERESSRNEGEPVEIEMKGSRCRSLELLREEGTREDVGPASGMSEDHLRGREGAITFVDLDKAVGGWNLVIE